MEELLKKIWEELNLKLLGFIKKRIKNSEDSEDILQEVYIKLHKNIGKLEDKDKIIPWIYQITRNAINDCYKRCYRIDKVELEENSSAFLTEEEEFNLNNEIGITMKSMIETLPKDSKEIIELYEFGNLTHREIGEKLNISENTSKSRLKRAKEKLKNQLDECCVFQIDKYGNILDFKKK